jgi:hypothetical protein
MLIFVSMSPLHEWYRSKGIRVFFCWGGGGEGIKLWEIWLDVLCICIHTVSLLLFIIFLPYSIILTASKP